MNKLLNRADAHNDTKGDLPCCSSSHLNANHCRKAARTPCCSDRWMVRVNLREYSRLLHILYTSEVILCANLLCWLSTLLNLRDMTRISLASRFLGCHDSMDTSVTGDYGYKVNVKCTRRRSSDTDVTGKLQSAKSRFHAGESTTCLSESCLSVSCSTQLLASVLRDSPSCCLQIRLWSSCFLLDEMWRAFK